MFWVALHVAMCRVCGRLSLCSTFKAALCIVEGLRLPFAESKDASCLSQCLGFRAAEGSGPTLVSVCVTLKFRAVICNDYGLGMPFAMSRVQNCLLKQLGFRTAYFNV